MKTGATAEFPVFLVVTVLLPCAEALICHNRECPQLWNYTNDFESSPLNLVFAVTLKNPFTFLIFDFLRNTLTVIDLLTYELKK